MFDGSHVVDVDVDDDVVVVGCCKRKGTLSFFLMFRSQTIFLEGRLYKNKKSSCEDSPETFFDTAAATATAAIACLHLTNMMIFL